MEFYRFIHIIVTVFKKEKPVLSFKLTQNRTTSDTLSANVKILNLFRANERFYVSIAQ